MDGSTQTDINIYLLRPYINVGPYTGGFDFLTKEDRETECIKFDIMKPNENENFKFNFELATNNLSKLNKLKKEPTMQSLVGKRMVECTN